MRHRLAVTLALGIFLPGAFAPATAQQSFEGYRISPGDVLSISVWGEEGLTGAYRVGPAGTIPMPMIGNVPVGGETLDGAETIVATALRQVIRRPNVTIALNEADSHRKIYVAGEVDQPGPLNLPFGATVADAISAAGIMPSADLRRITVTNSGQEPRVLDLSGLRSDEPIPAFEPVRYGDSIYVPRLEDRIAVLGEVQNPGQMVMPIGERVTVLDAVSRIAGGLTENADRGSAMIIRRDEPPINVDLRALLQEGDLTQNEELRPGDVVVVREAGEVSVLGEVNNPLSFKLVEEMDTLEVLARAGGVTPEAGLSRAQVITEDGAVPIDLEGLLERGEMQYNVTLQPGDVLLVPRAEPETVLVLGAVEHPGIINIRDQEQRDLLRLLTVAVPAPTADLETVSVYREDGRVVADVRAMMDEGDMTDNIALRPDDIVMVPELEKIYLLGAASTTGPLPLTDDLTLLEVVSRYGNFAHGNLRQVTVMRLDENGQPEFLRRDMGALHREVAPEDMKLQQGDIVFIPYAERGFSWSEVRNALWGLGTILGLLDRL